MPKIPRWKPVVRIVQYAGSAFLLAAVPVVAFRVYCAVHRYKVTKELLEALESNDESLIATVCKCAEDAGVDSFLTLRARKAQRKLQACALLADTCRSGDAQHILQACRTAKESDVDDVVVSEARIKASSLIRNSLECSDVNLILTAVPLAQEADIDQATVRAGLASARLLAEAQLQEACLRGVAAGISKACALVETAGGKRSMVFEGRTQALRLRAEAELQAAVRDGHYERIAEAIARAQEAGVDSALVTDVAALARRLQATDQLLLALDSKSKVAKQLEVCLRRADHVGVDAAILTRAGIELGRLQEYDAARRAEGESRLAVALEGNKTSDQLFQACRYAEDVGVDEWRIAIGRSEARRLFDLKELDEAIKVGDRAKAYFASGGSPIVATVPR